MIGEIRKPVLQKRMGFYFTILLGYSTWLIKIVVNITTNDVIFTTQEMTGYVSVI